MDGTWELAWQEKGADDGCWEDEIEFTIPIDPRVSHRPDSWN